MPWAGQRSRFTLLYERFTIEVLLACHSVSAAAELLRLSWDELQTRMKRAVQRGLERRELEGFRHVGMDEKSFGRGQSYISLLTDLDRARVLEVTKENQRAAADLLLATLPPEVRAAIEAVCSDMSGHFAAAAREGLPEAALVHDRFLISAYLNDGVAAAPREEHRRLQKLGDGRLKGTQRLFGFNPDKLDEESRAYLRAERDKVSRRDVLAREWAIVEAARDGLGRHAPMAFCISAEGNELAPDQLLALWRGSRRQGNSPASSAARPRGFARSRGRRDAGRSSPIA